MEKYLVCYHTKTGSTRETAELIAESLKKKGCIAELHDIAGIKTINQYDSIIIGAPINGMQWVPQAVEFTEIFGDDLQKKKTAIFCLSYIYFTGGKFWKKVIEKALQKEAKKIHAKKYGIFGGRIDSSLPSPMHLIFGIPKNAPLSLQDTAAIESWVEEFVDGRKTIPVG